MFSEFQLLFNNFQFLSKSDLSAIYQTARIKKIKAGDKIVNEGETFSYVIYVVKGLLRNYTLDSKGVENTLKFTDKRNPTAIPECIFQNLPSPEFIDTLEDSTVILINVKKFKDLSLKRPRLMQSMNIRMGDFICEMAAKIRFFTILTPEERYIHLIKDNKSLINRVEDRYLASYIGITPVSYSRIKSRIKIP